MALALQKIGASFKSSLADSLFVLGHFAVLGRNFQSRSIATSMLKDFIPMFGNCHPGNLRVDTRSIHTSAKFLFCMLVAGTFQGTVSAQQAYVEIAGNGIAGYSGDVGTPSAGPATGARLNNPRGVAIDMAGNIYIADWLNHRLRKVTPSGAISAIAGTGVGATTGDNGNASMAALNLPMGVAIAPNGDIYVSESASGGRIRRVSTSTGIITTVAGNGAASLAGDGGPGVNASLYSPGGIAFDNAGNLYVADIFNQRIRKLTAGGTITTVAGSSLSGTTGGAFSGDGGQAVMARLNNPNAVAVDLAGNLYIADTSNHRIRKVTTAGVISTIAGTGTPSLGGDGGPATSALLYNPTGIAIDSGGNIFISEAGNNRIRMINPGGIISTVSTSLNQPYGIVTLPSGAVLIADTGNHRVRLLPSVGASTITVTSNINPATTSQSVTFTALMTNAGATGSITFRSDTSAIVGCISVPLIGGTASCTTIFASAGSYIVSADYNGDGNNLPSTGTLALSQVINSTGGQGTISQAITFGPTPTITVGGNGTISATGGASGNPVTFASTTPAICSTSGNNGALVAGVAIGSCTIVANQAGNATYSPAPQASLSFAISIAQVGGCANLPPPVLNLVFCDDFGGTSLNAALWGSIGDAVTVHDGFADVQQNVQDKAATLFTTVSPLKRMRFEVRHKLHSAGSYAGGIKFDATDYINGSFALLWPNFIQLQSTAGACWNKTTVVIRSSFDNCFAVSAIPSSSFYDQWMVTIVEYDTDTGLVTVDFGGDGSIELSAVVPPNNRFPINTITFASGGWGTGHTHQVDYARLSGVLADAQPPSVPTGLSTTALNANQVTLSWAASTDNVAVTGYKIYSDGILVATLGNFTNYGPLNTTPYGFTVSACDASGNCSAKSQATTVSPPSTVTNPIPSGGMVAAGSDHALVVKPDGSLLAWGKNDSGQLGDGSTTLRSYPIIVGNGFVAVAGGGAHTAAVKTDGSLWTWGNNSNGQLGDGTTTSRSNPVMIGTGFKSVAAGLYHTVAIKADGTIWAWGANNYGQLGDGTTSQKTSRVQVGSNFRSVSSGSYHVLAVKSDNSLWAWGLNDPFGSVGDGTSINRLSPVSVGGGFDSVAGGGAYSMAIKTNGSLWGWGNNWFGNLGNGSSRIERNDPMQVGTGYVGIAAGGAHTLGLKPDGTLWAWGQNLWGQLGTGTTSESSNPVLVLLGTGFRAIAAGAQFSVALKFDGTVLAWGQNIFGQVGDGTLATRTAPAIVLHENGTGTVAGNDWFVDLNPSIAKTIPNDKIPAFLAVATSAANNVTANILYRAQDVGSTAKTYVFALAPANLVQSASAVSASSSSKGIKSAATTTATAAAGSCVLAQLNSSGQLVATSADSLQAYLTGVLTAQGASVAVLNGVSTALLQGTTFFVGYGTSPSTMLSGGTNRSVLSIGELQACTTPSGFSFVPQTGVALNVPVTSSPLIISGANFVAAPISVTNGNYRINNGAFVPSVGLILQGDTVAAQVFSSPAPNTQTCATIDISGVTSPFCVTTGQASVTNYTLTVSMGGMGTGTVNSNPTGIACGMDCSADYASGTLVSLSAIPAMGSTFAGWSGTCTGTTTCMVSMDGVKIVTATFAPAPVTTTPDPFTFNAQTGAGLNETRTSNTIVLGGANFVSAPISITNGSYRINNGAYTAIAGSVYSGDGVTLQLLSSPNYSTQRDATLNVGGVTGTFSVTTMAQPVITAPLVMLGANSMGFPSQYVGSISAAQVVNVTNSGNATLNFASISAIGDFALTNNCGSSLGSGNGCTLLVTFAPTAAGTRNGAISINSDAAGSPHTVLLSGVGLLPSAPDAPISLNATAGNALASITFSPPANNGGAVITSYAASCLPGPITATGYYAPIIVTGLTNGVTYTCSVTATNAAGTSIASTSVNVMPAASIPFALIGARSRKIHSAAGAFELPIDLTQSITGLVTVEPRFSGGGHKIVFQFNGPVSSVGSVDITPLGSAVANFSGNEVVVTVWNVQDNRRATVTLANVNGATPAQASLGFLVGDVNSSGTVNSGDISAVKARVGQATHGANFKFDLNASGSINTGDTSIVKARAGLTLP